MNDQEDQNQNQSPQLFADRSQEVMAQSDAAAVARATQEVQAALVIAQRFPRDEVRAESRIIEACRRKGLAEVAEYEYSRGGTRITGPTIDLLRAIANRWGNIEFGWAEVERRNGQSFVRCFAWDLQSNGKAFRTFVVRHWRDTSGGGYALEDERDIYELIANMAARRVRACLEEIIDADIVDKAVEQCRKTLREGQKLPIKDRAAKVLIAFAEFGVTQEMIEKRLGNKMDAVSENQLASLRRIHTSLKDGVGKREDYFKGAVEPPKFGEPAPESSPAPAAPTQESAEEIAAQVKAWEQSVKENPPQKVFPPEQPSQQPQQSKPTSSPLRLLREMCRVTKIKESVLLGFLAEIGASDGSVATLEELQMTNPTAVQSAIASWPDLSAKIKAAQEVK